MKKKILLVVLMLVATIAMLSGCQNIIKKNQERVQNQVLATVAYNGESGVVTYGELFESYNSYGYVYVNYYGYSVEETLKLLLTQLANRELLYLYAKDEIAKAKHGPAANGRDYSIESLLTKSEIDKAVRATNADLESAVKSLADSLREEDEANKGVIEETEEPDGKTYQITFEREEGYVANPDERDPKIWGADPDPIRQKSGNTVTLPENPYIHRDGLKFLGWKNGDDTYAANSSVTVMNGDAVYTAEWGTNIPDARPVREEAEKADDAAETDPDDKAFEDAYDMNDDTVAVRAKMILSVNGKDAFNPKYKEEQEAKEKTELIEDEYFERAMAKLLKNLASSYKTYDYYYRVQLKTVIMERFEKMIKGDITVSDAAVQAEYDRIVAANRESFKKSSTAYSDAISSSLSGTVYHEKPAAYAYVYNILLKFDDEEFAELNRVYKNNTANDAAFQAYVEQIARAKTIWISNSKYTTAAGTDDEEKAKHIVDENGVCAICGAPHLDSDHYNNLITVDLAEKTITVNAYTCATQAYLPEKWPAYDVFEDGVLVKKGIVTQVQESLQLVADSDLSPIDKMLLSQELAKTWVYLVGDDGGMYANSDSYNPLGYVFTLEGDSSYITEFTKRGRELFAAGGLAAYSDLKTLGQEGGSGNEVVAAAMSSGYAGIFMIVPGIRPFDEEQISEIIPAENTIEIIDEKGEQVTVNAREYYLTQHLLPLDYTVIYGKDKKTESITIRKTLEDTIKAGLEADAYNNYLNAFLKKNPNAVVKDDKVYKSLLKDAGLA
ncbi:MAG: hypothetical protein LBC13_02910 [Clostridiales bacterium]|nr:hypothetical protein [Clostridiales bacterium]